MMMKSSNMSEMVVRDKEATGEIALVDETITTKIHTSKEVVVERVPLAATATEAVG